MKKDNNNKIKTEEKLVVCKPVLDCGLNLGKAGDLDAIKVKISSNRTNSK